MGMTGDFEEAIEEGATVVRVGQAIFGKRPTLDGYYWPRHGLNFTTDVISIRSQVVHGHVGNKTPIELVKPSSGTYLR